MPVGCILPALKPYVFQLPPLDVSPRGCVAPEMITGLQWSPLDVTSDGGNSRGGYFWGGGPKGWVCLGGVVPTMWPIPWCMQCTYSLSRQNDRLPWKHYLPATSLAGGNYSRYKWLSESWPAWRAILKCIYYGHVLKRGTCSQWHLSH